MHRVKYQRNCDENGANHVALAASGENREFNLSMTALIFEQDK